MKNQAGRALVHSTERQLARSTATSWRPTTSRAIEHRRWPSFKSATRARTADAIRQKTEALAQGRDEDRRGDVSSRADARRLGRRDRRRGTGGSSDEGVVDADFEEVDDDKNSKSA